MRWGRRTVLLILIVLAGAALFFTRSFWQPPLLGWIFPRQTKIETFKLGLDTVVALIGLGPILYGGYRFFFLRPTEREKIFDPENILIYTSPEKILDDYVGARGKQINWIDRGAGTLEALRTHHRVAIVGRMKSGKSREAAELLRRAIGEEIIYPGQAFDLTRSIIPFTREMIADHLNQRVDPTAHSFYYINDLPMQYETGRLPLLDAVLSVLGRYSDARMVITARTDHLTNKHQEWLKRNHFEIVELKEFSPELIGRLVDNSAGVLGLQIDEKARNVLIKNADGTPAQTIQTLVRIRTDLVGIHLVNEQFAEKYSKETLISAWTRVRLELIHKESLIEPILDALATMWRVGIPAYIDLVELYISKIYRDTRYDHRRFDDAVNLLRPYDVRIESLKFIFPDVVVEVSLPTLTEARNILSKILLDEKLYRRNTNQRKSQRLMWMTCQALVIFTNTESFNSKEELQKATNCLELIDNFKTKIFTNEMYEKFILYRAFLLSKQKRYEEATLLIQEILYSNPDQLEPYLLKAGILTEQNKEIEAEQALQDGLSHNPTNAIGWYTLGTVRGQQDRLVEAEQALKKAVDINPNYISAWLDLGQIYVNDHRFEEAIQSFRSAINSGDQSASTWYLLGVLLSEQGNIDEAIQAYHAAIHVDPNFVSAWSNLGLLLSNRGNKEEAEKCYWSAIRTDAKDAPAWFNLGILKSEQEKWNEAEDAYRSSIEADQKFFNAWNNLGLLLLKQGRKEEAEQTFREAIRINPQYDEGWVHLGYIFLERKLLSESEDAFRNAILLNPQNSRGWFNLGLLLVVKDNSGDAENTFYNALETDEKILERVEELVTTFLNNEQSKEAEQVMRAILRAYPKHTRAWFTLGNLLMRKDEIGEAEQAYRKALHVDPSCAPAWNFLGNLLIKQKKFIEAEQAYRQALEADPQDVSTWHDLGTLYRSLKQYTMAREALEQAVLLRQERAVYRANLGDVYQKLGMQIEAEREFSVAMSLVENESIYNRACVMALTNQTDNAFVHLEQALTTGEISRDWVSWDPDWDDLRNHPFYQKIIQED